MSIVVDMFSSAINKNQLYKNILRLKMLPQIKVRCVLLSHSNKERFFLQFSGFLSSLVLRKNFRSLSMGKTIALLTHNFK